MAWECAPITSCPAMPETFAFQYSSNANAVTPTPAGTSQAAGSGKTQVWRGRFLPDKDPLSSDRVPHSAAKDSRAPDIPDHAQNTTIGVRTRTPMKQLRHRP
jgi:hypothetical protein